MDKIYISPLIEAFIASLGIMLFGWITVPIVGMFSGVEITLSQGIKMSLYFFIIRLAWLYAVRLFFSKRYE